MVCVARRSRASSLSSKPETEEDSEVSSSSPLLSARIEDTSEVRGLFLCASYQHDVSHFIDNLTELREKFESLLISSTRSETSRARDLLIGAMCSNWIKANSTIDLC